MLDVVLGLLAVLAGGMVLELFAATRAPLGYQDEHGFHLGIPVRQAPDASVLATAAPTKSRTARHITVPTELQPANSL